MDFFKRYGAIGPSQQQSATETIERLAGRVETATLAEDRRAAVLGLKGLSKQYRRETGEAGLGALVGALRAAEGDQNLAKAVLETLTNLCGRGQDEGDDEVGAELAQQLLMDEEVVADLLGQAGDSDFYVRYYAVQLLGTLHSRAGAAVQDRVLAAAAGVGRLVDLLSDGRDIIRNEGLQVLMAMTESNADIQKIVAFEGAFERLLAIVGEEGGVRGNIVVQDCLQLLHNLLNYNVSNQNLFRETGCVQGLPALLSAESEPEPEPESDQDWPPQHARNMLVVLDVVRMLIQPGNTNTAANQTAMQRSGALPPLLQLALADDAPPPVRAQALYAVGDIVRAHPDNQSLFQRVVVAAQGGTPEPAVTVVIRLAVGPADLEASEKPSATAASSHTAYYPVRAAAAHLVRAYVSGNNDAQLALAGTLAGDYRADGSDQAESEQSPGSLMVTALLHDSSDPWRLWHAALLLSTLVRDDAACKDLALRVEVGDSARGEDPLPLLNELLAQARRSAREGGDVRRTLAPLTLASVWLADFPHGVATLLGESANVTFLAELVSGDSAGALVQGLAAFLLGLVYQFDLDATSPVPRADLYPILSARVGVDQLLARVRRLRDSREFQYAAGLAAGTNANAYGGMPDAVFFDPVFTDLFKSHYEGFCVAVRSGPDASDTSPTPSRTDSTPAPPDSVSKAEYDALAEEVARLRVQATQPPSQPAADSAPSDLQRELDAAKAEAAAAKSLEEDLRRKLANAEKQAVKAAAAGRNSSKKKEQQQSATVDALRADVAAKDSEISNKDTEIAALNARVAELTQSADDMKQKLAEVEKEQEDLLVYLADQDQQAKDYRAMLRKHGEDIPPSDDDDDDE
ncbi:Vesicle-mediated ER to Golgi transport protein [Coemansia sp. RSA 552]|nr:Vesicle-mediated ER to Golgi transport protein [Coemansia sp. RSA 552]